MGWTGLWHIMEGLRAHPRKEALTWGLFVQQVAV